MSQPLVSVLIPGYNCEEYIEECITSVLNQTYSNIEIVFVNDGSTDKSRAVVASLSDKIKIIDQENMGRGGARNTCLKHYSGDYVTFLDADDLLISDSIEKRVSFLESKQEFDWVCADAMEFNEAGDMRKFMKQFSWVSWQDDIFSQLLRGCFSLTTTVLLRASLARDIGSFRSELNYGEDIDYFMKAALLGRLGYINEVVSKRRIHDSQAVSSTYNRWNSRVDIYTNFTAPIELSSIQKICIKKYLSHAYFKLGECYWERYDMKSARENFLKSKTITDEWPAKKYIKFTYLPVIILKVLRSIS